jgi:hypothetical protein
MRDFCVGGECLDSLWQIDFESRLQKGVTCARKAAVTSIELLKNTILARVLGSAPTPYKVKITIPELSERKQIQGVIASSPLYFFIRAAAFLIETQTLNAELSERISRQSAVIVQALQDPLYNNDKMQADNIINAFFTGSEILSISVTNGLGSLMTEKTAVSNIDSNRRGYCYFQRSGILRAAMSP